MRILFLSCFSVFIIRHYTGISGSCNHGNIHTLLQGFDACPAPGTLLLCSIPDTVYQLLATFIVLFAENIGCDVNQKAVQLSLLIFTEYFCQLRIIEMSDMLQ